MVTHSYAESGDAFFVALVNDRFSESYVVRFPIGDDHHRFGGPRSTAAALVEAPLTDGSKRAGVTTSQRIRNQRHTRTEGATNLAY